MSKTFFLVVSCLLSTIVLVGCDPSADSNPPESVAETAADYAVSPVQPEIIADDGTSAEAGIQPLGLAPGDDVASDLDTVPELDVLSDLDSIGPEKPTLESFVMQIQQSLQEGKIEAAVAAAKDAHLQLTDDPRTTVVLANISMVMARSGDISGALSLIESLPESVTDRDLRMVLLQLYQQSSQTTSDHSESLAMIQKATAIVREIGADQPWAGDFYYDEAVLLAKNEHPEKSLEVLREAFESGYAELAASMAEEAFAGNESAAKIIAEFAVLIREKIRAKIRAEMVATESFSFEFDLTTVAGEPVSTSDLRGKIVIVDFWGTWCPPCRREIPHFIALGKKYADDLAVVGLNYNERGDTDEEQAAHITEFMMANDMNYPCAIGDPATRRQVPEFEGFPTTLFLDRTGNVRLKLVGLHSYEKLEAVVLELIAEGAPSETATSGEESSS